MCSQWQQEYNKKRPTYVTSYAGAARRAREQQGLPAPAESGADLRKRSDGVRGLTPARRSESIVPFIFLGVQTPLSVVSEFSRRVSLQSAALNK